MEEIEFPVIIAGGGPVGLALAIGLARQGVRSLVLESEPAIPPQSRALGILARTLEIFRDCGIYDRFVAEGVLLIEAPIYRAGRSAPIATVDLRSLARHTATPGILVLPQNKTETILLRCAQETGMVDVRLGHAATVFEEDATGVTLQVAPEGQPAYPVRGTYLVGCDGAHSVVRAQLGWHLEGKTYAGRVALADIRLADERDQLPWPRVAVYGRSVLAGLRYEPNCWRIICPVPGLDADETAIGPEALASIVAHLFGPGPFETLWASVFNIHCRTSPHFRRGRVMLAGDAAHINSPAGGQGMNSGIQDAHNLAWKLAGALEGGSDDLLASYEQERRVAVVSDVDRYTDFLTRTILLPPPSIRALFLGVAGAAMSLPGVLERVVVRMGMLDTRYRDTVLLRGHGRWLGQRAPDGDLIRAGGEKLRVLDLAGPDAALLLFDDGRLPHWPVEQIRAEMAHVPHLKVVPVLRSDAVAAEGCRDADGSVWRAWAATRNTAALLRPDGFVGWMAQNPSLDELRAGVEGALGRGAAVPVTKDE